MPNETYTIRQVTLEDTPLVEELITRDWGGEPFAIRGEYFYPSRLPGFIACSGDTVMGYVFYEIRDHDCEVIVLKALKNFQGIGTKLMDQVKQLAKDKGYKRIFLMTTNDNVDALRFYQKRGFHIFKISVNAFETTRKLMPHISYYGRYGIARRDEIYLEMNTC